MRGCVVALFLSTTTNKIDKKGRVSVPSQFRSVLSASSTVQNMPSIVLYRSLISPIIEGCDYQRLARLSEQLETQQLKQACGEENISSTQGTSFDYISLMFAEAQILTIDAEGRISIPQSLIRHAGIIDSITFVGRGPTFELWSPAQFEQHHEEARQRLLQLHRGGK